MINYTYILFNCPACGNTLKIPKSLSGSQGCCPFCEYIVQAPINKEKVLHTHRSGSL